MGDGRARRRGRTEEELLPGCPSGLQSARASIGRSLQTQPASPGRPQARDDTTLCQRSIQFQGPYVVPSRLEEPTSNQFPKVHQAVLQLRASEYS